MTTDKMALLVHGDPNGRAAILRSLRKYDLHDAVAVAEDEVEAMEWLLGSGRHAGRTPAGLPRVIIADLRPPCKDGLSLIERVRADARTSLVPIVVLSSSQKEEDIARCYALGANSVVYKLGNAEGFSEALAHLGLYWICLNEPPAAGLG
jgi:two-component system response regulator